MNVGCVVLVIRVCTNGEEDASAGSAGAVLDIGPRQNTTHARKQAQSLTCFHTVFPLLTHFCFHFTNLHTNNFFVAVAQTYTHFPLRRVTQENSRHTHVCTGRENQRSLMAVGVTAQAPSIQILVAHKCTTVPLFISDHLTSSHTRKCTVTHIHPFVH